jgi:hypothetical protein
LRALLHEQFDSVTLEQLFAEGGSMSEHEACRIAVED